MIVKKLVNTLLDPSPNNPEQTNIIELPKTAEIPNPWSDSFEVSFIAKLNSESIAPTITLAL